MSALLPADRTRFLKIVSLLASDKTGERDAAALATMRFLRQRGLSWSDVIASPAPIVLPTSRPAPCHWRQLVQGCLRHPGSLRPWEAGFLRNLSEFPRLSQKQLIILTEIAERLGVTAECAA